VQAIASPGVCSSWSPLRDMPLTEPGAIVPLIETVV
jgi:hypothetical protein